MTNEDDLPESVEFLGSRKLATDGPFRVTIKVMGIAGEYDANMEVGLRPGMVPTDDDIREAIANAEKALKDSNSEGRLATRHEFLRRELREHSGISNISVPGPNAFRLVQS